MPGRVNSVFDGCEDLVKLLGQHADNYDLSFPYSVSIAVSDGKSFLAQFVQEGGVPRSEEHTSELQSLMRISYAVFCLKKKNIGGTAGKKEPNNTPPKERLSHSDNGKYVQRFPIRTEMQTTVTLL